MVTAFFKAGVPLNRLDCFHQILEESALRLTSCDNLRDYIPFVQQQEQESVKRPDKWKASFCFFDETTHVCEALFNVLQFVDEKWNLQQRVVQLLLLAKSMSGEELARQLIVCLSTELAISLITCLCMQDWASVNSVAVRRLKIVFPKLFNIGCFSHTIDHVGERFNTPLLNDFMKTWIGIFSRCPKSRLAWQTNTGLKPPSYSPTRWWSKWEVMKHIRDLFGVVKDFLTVKSCHLPRQKFKIFFLMILPAESYKWS